MALIKCPECGREISDRAAICPQCGYPINTGRPHIQENTIHSESPKGKKRMPTWLLALIIEGSLLLLIGGIVVLFVNGNTSENTTIQDSIQEEKIADIVYPNITEKGVEPFLFGTSMFDISTKGNYYDTIILEKRYSAYIDGGFYCGSDMNEEELLKLKKEYRKEGITLIVKSYGYTCVLQDSDTLIKVYYDDKALVRGMEVRSKHIQMENGIHVGMSAQEMYEKYNAKCKIPYDTYAFECGFGDDIIFEIPDNPKNISIKAHYDEKYHKYLENRGFDFREEYYPLPLELVKDNSVRSIEIYKPKK